MASYRRTHSRRRTDNTSAMQMACPVELHYEFTQYTITNTTVIHLGFPLSSSLLLGFTGCICRSMDSCVNDQFDYNHLPYIVQFHSRYLREAGPYKSVPAPVGIGELSSP